MKDYSDEINFKKNLRILSRFANPREKIIKKIYKTLEYSDDPKYFQYGALLFSSSDANDAMSNSASGFSFFSETEALLKCIAESLERYSVRTFTPNETIFGSFKKLYKFYPLVSPDNFVSLSSEQKKLQKTRLFEYTNKTPFTWCLSYDAIKRREVYIPLQLISFKYNLKPDEKLIYVSTTTGVAFGTSEISAKRRAVLEIIERDAFLLHYLTRSGGNYIDLKDETIDKKISSFVDYIESYNLKVVCRELLTELGVPTYLSIIINESGIGPSLSFGLKTSIDYVEGILGSLQESLHSRGWVRKIYEEGQRYSGKKPISTLEERALYWYESLNLKNIDFFLRKTKKARLEKKILNEKDYLIFLKKKIEENKMSLYLTDITPEKIKSSGFYVTKAIIPELQPFYLSEEFPCWGGNRLYNFPSKKFGGHINKIPHPFL